MQRDDVQGVEEDDNVGGGALPDCQIPSIDTLEASKAISANTTAVPATEDPRASMRTLPIKRNAAVPGCDTRFHTSRSLTGGKSLRGQQAGSPAPYEDT